MERSKTAKNKTKQQLLNVIIYKIRKRYKIIMKNCNHKHYNITYTCNNLSNKIYNALGNKTYNKALFIFN